MSLFRPVLEINSGKLGIWEITEGFRQLESMTIEHGFGISGIKNFRSELKKKQWLSARCLLKFLDAQTGDIKYKIDGSPFLENGKFLSLSHSHNMVAALIDNTGEVGVDIQYFSKKIFSIKHKFCSNTELDYVSGGLEYEYLHAIWSAKESIYKKVKQNGLSFNTQIEISQFDLSEKGEISALILLGNNRLKIALNYEFLGDYVLAYTLNP